MNAVSDVKRAAALAQDPGALLGAALGAIHASPSTIALLSPAGQQVFAAAYTAASEALGVGGGQILSALGDAALEGVIAAIGPDIVDAAAGIADAAATAIGDAIPVVNLYVSILQILEALPHATGSADTTVSDCAEFWYALPGHSGPSDPVTGNTATTPADVFASGEGPLVFDPTTNTMTTALTMRRPDSALGACLAGVTEGWSRLDQNVDGDGPIRVNWHSLKAMVSLGPGAYASVVPGTSVSIPVERQAIYRALRHACAANGPDHGVIAWSLWWDMFCADIDAGRLPPGWIMMLLSGSFNDGGGFTVDICQLGPPKTMTDQIVAMAEQWRTTRKLLSKSGSIHLSFGQDALLLVLAKEKFGPGLVSMLHRYSGAVQASLLLEAYRKSLAKPVFTFHLNPSVLAFLK